MIKEALQYVVGLNAPHIEKFHEGSYADKPMRRIEAPLAESLNVTTLTALLAYIRENRDEINLANAIIHIKSPSAVVLMSDLNADREREEYIEATAILPTFRYGNFYECESFSIALQSMFADADDRSIILKIAGSLAGERMKDAAGDGITQLSGVRVVGYENVPSPVTLRPYRTFAEVVQPASKFVFRIHEDAKLALFEADGGVWRNTAMGSIKSYLIEQLEDMGLSISILA